MKTTPLNATHREAGARMVDFGGWDMPLHYGSQLDEHHAVRRDAGIFDVSHMRVVDLTGPDTRAFLRYALANNVDKLAIPGKALYTCMLAEDGGVRDDLIVYFLNDYHFRLVVNAATADTDVAWLEALRDRTGPGVSIRPRTDFAILAVQGPNARAKAWQALPGTESATAGLKPFSAASAGDLFVARTGYTGEDGFEIVVPASHVVDAWNALVAAGVKPAGLGARDTLRLEAGMNLYGQDMDERVSPLDAGLAWTVDLESPRDFVGKDALVAQPATRQLAGLVLLDAGGVLRAHQKVRTAHGDGEITSGTFGPTIARSIALARLPLDVAVGDVVDVEVRDKTLRARVAKPPFVRHGQVKVDVG
ncbi:MAG: glycine cleavage system aminomethyltransferase GcvT [Vicinamibacteria bacterium]|jgi:aminomethyltransferase